MCQSYVQLPHHLQSITFTINHHYLCGRNRGIREKEGQKKEKKKFSHLPTKKKNSLPAPVHASDGVLVSIVVNVGVLVSKFVNPNEAS